VCVCERERERRPSAARNKRNLTWRRAHFLNGMFPLALTGIMHRLRITGEKSPWRRSPPPPPCLPVPAPAPPPRRPADLPVGGKRSVMCRRSCDFSLSRRDAAVADADAIADARADRYKARSRFVLCYARCISTVSFTRLPRGDPFQYPPVRAMVPSPD